MSSDKLDEMEDPENIGGIECYFLTEKGEKKDPHDVILELLDDDSLLNQDQDLWCQVIDEARRKIAQNNPRLEKALERAGQRIKERDNDYYFRVFKPRQSSLNLEPSQDDLEDAERLREEIERVNGNFYPDLATDKIIEFEPSDFASVVLNIVSSLELGDDDYENLGFKETDLSSVVKLVGKANWNDPHIVGALRQNVGRVYKYSFRDGRNNYTENQLRIMELCLRVGEYITNRLAEQ